MATVANIGTYHSNSPLGHLRVDFFRKGDKGAFARPIIARITAQNGTRSDIWTGDIYQGICRTSNQRDRYVFQQKKEVLYTPFTDFDEQDQNTILTALFDNTLSLSVIGELDSYNRLHASQIIIG